MISYPAKRIVEQGFPFFDSEREPIGRYCFDDMLLLEKLADVVVPKIVHFGQAVMRGRYVVATAEMFYRGMPADPWTAPLLGQAKGPSGNNRIGILRLADAGFSEQLKYHILW